MAAQFVEILKEKSNELGAYLINWARPEGWSESPLSSWPLARAEDAFPIALGYLAFIAVGCLVMQFLPPVKGLYPIKFIYNISQVMLCSYMCIEALVRGYQAGYTVLPCVEFNQTQPVIGFVLYVFYLSKILDFMDTVFIILEKKWKQLSFLHVYHHTSIFLFYWLNINVGYDGDVFLTIILNGLIHTVMYAYYFVSMHTHDIWWKSALTLCQIVQFVVMNAQAFYLLSTGCQQYPPNIIKAYLYYILSLLVLFVNFYIMSYVVKGDKNAKRKVKAT